MKVGGWVWVLASRGAAAPQCTGSGTQSLSARGSAQPGMGATGCLAAAEVVSFRFF